MGWTAFNNIDTQDNWQYAQKNYVFNMHVVKVTETMEVKRENVTSPSLQLFHLKITPTQLLKN
jgi:hypothetical protein